MSIAPFTPTFIFEDELTQYGLPTPEVQPDILNLVSLASVIIDEACGRMDGDGSGSLVYTTYTQRLLLQTRNRNLVQIPLKPIVPVSQTTVDELAALATSGSNYYYTGVQVNTLTQASSGLLSGVISASGRYGYTRQDMSIAYPDLFAFINPLNLVTMFGGPAPWVAIDVTQMDYDSKTGEAWIPAGLQLQKYSEILITYNSGFDPRRMPRAIKMVTAALVKNALGRGDGTTGLKALTLGRAGANVTFTDDMLDPVLQRMLVPFTTVRAY